MKRTEEAMRKTRFLVTYIREDVPFGDEWLVVNGAAFQKEIEYDTSYNETGCPYDHSFYPVEEEIVRVERCRLRDIPSMTQENPVGDFYSEPIPVVMKSCWCVYAPPKDGVDLVWDEVVALLFFKPELSEDEYGILVGTDGLMEF